MAGVSVIQRNGVSEIYIDGRKVDMSKAKVIEETPDYTVYIPEEDGEVRIKVGKNGGLTVTNRGSTQIMIGGVGGRPMTPAEKAKFDAAMAHLDQNMKDLQFQMGHLGYQINRQVQQSLAKTLGSKLSNSYW